MDGQSEVQRKFTCLRNCLGHCQFFGANKHLFLNWASKDN